MQSVSRALPIREPMLSGELLVENGGSLSVIGGRRLEDVASGNLEFASFFQSEFPAIVHTVSLIVGSREEARDIAQEAFIRLLMHWKKVSGYEKPGAWVRRVAIRLATRWTAKSALLSNALTNMQPGREPSPADPDIRTAILSLPKAQRAAVVLYYLEDFPMDEVAASLGCAVATAKVHLHRARKRLAQILGEEVENVVR